MSAYKEKRRAAPIFVAALKQEPIKKAKNKDGRVRLFGASPLPFTLLFRQFYLPVIAFIMANRHRTGVAVGMNCCSPEWKTLYEGLTAGDRGSRIVAGDYSKFDKRMSHSFVRGAFDVMIWLAEKFGTYSQLDLTWMGYMADEVTYHYLSVKGDLILMPNSNPSGQSATVIVNSIVNIMYLMYALARKVGWQSAPQVMRDNVYFMVYGDDNILSSDLPWFSHIYLADTLRGIGQEYTMPDKESEAVHFLPIESVSFLKRGFYRDPETKLVMAPLAEESIAKMLRWVVRSPSLGIHLQSAYCLQDACEQYFMFGR